MLTSLADEVMPMFGNDSSQACDHVDIDDEIVPVFGIDSKEFYMDWYGYESSFRSKAFAIHSPNFQGQLIKKN